MWLAKKFEPGCAFSRSLGDATAEAIGCVPTPEVETHELSDDDVLCVIASDGIWDVMTNAGACSIVASALASGAAPGDAARRLCVAALRQRSDDNVSAAVLVVGA